MRRVLVQVSSIHTYMSRKLPDFDARYILIDFITRTRDNKIGAYQIFFPRLKKRSQA